MNVGVRDGRREVETSGGDGGQLALRMTTPGGLFAGETSDSELRRGGRVGRTVEIKLDRLFEKPPPASPLAEMALLGAIILEPDVLHEVMAVVRGPEAFYSEAHGAIYKALVTTYDQKQAGNLVLLAEALEASDLLKPVGGLAYLEKLASETPGPATAVHFAKIVADKARLRRLIRAGGQIVFDAYHAPDAGPEGSREVVDRAEQLIFDIAQQEETSDAQPLSVLVQQEYDKLLALQGKGVSGVATGYPDLDELTSGLQPGEMIIVAARPSMGKTALMLNLVEQMSRGGAGPGMPARQITPVGVFSLEMSKASIAQRLLSSASGYSSHDMRSGRLQEADYDEVCKAVYELAELPIFIDDTPGLTALALRTRARRLVAQHGVKALFIDYLQLMSAPNAARESRQVEVSTISRGIKALARELNVPVVCLSQLNRGPESRGDNRPRMSDLRESGSIEQDADVVMLLHRESYYHVGDPEWDPKNPNFNIENEGKLNLAELIIAKQRNGPTDVVKLTWDSRVVRFFSHASASTGTGLSPGYARSGPRSPGTGGFGGGGGGGGGGGFGGPGPGGGGGGASGGAGGGDWQDPFRVQVVPFAPGKKTGPIDNHRDGGGPDREDPPFES